MVTYFSQTRQAKLLNFKDLSMDLRRGYRVFQLSHHREWYRMKVRARFSASDVTGIQVRASVQAMLVE